MSPQSVQAQIATILLALSLFAPAIGHAGRRDPTPPVASALSTVRIDNFGRLNPAYYRGAEPDDEEYAHLASLGIRTVVDLRSDDVDEEDRSLVEAAGMKYAQVPMTTHVPPTAATVETFLQIVTDPANQPVYVHCAGGRHRTGVMTAVYRMTQDRWTPDQAFLEMKQYKFGPDFLHREFKRFVYAYRVNAALAGDAGD